MPHAVAVDEARAGALGDRQHAAVDVRGHAREQLLGRGAHALGPELAHEVVVAADAAGCHDHGRRAQLEVADDVAVARLAAPRGIRVEHRAAHADDRARLDDELVDAVAVPELDEARCRAGLRRAR